MPFRIYFVKKKRQPEGSLKKSQYSKDEEAQTTFSSSCNAVKFHVQFPSDAKFKVFLEFEYSSWRIKFKFGMQTHTMHQLGSVDAVNLCNFTCLCVERKLFSKE